MPYRARAFAVALTFATILSTGYLPGAGPDPAAASTPKVAIIVGPTNITDSHYHPWAKDLKKTAEAAGATVDLRYCATPAQAKAATSGANIVVYFGHGNGFPNPYSGTELTDRVNGFGLRHPGVAWSADTCRDNDTLGHKLLQYYGEDHLTGKLTTNGWGSGGLAPAPNFVMVMSNACYAPGAGESRPAPPESVALQRVANYSTPFLELGGTYFATDLGSGKIVDLILRNSSTPFGTLFEQGNGFSAAALKRHAHPDFAGQEAWVHRTTNQWLGDDYWYAFAGNPNATPSGSTVAPAAKVVKLRPNANSTNAGVDAIVSVTFDQPVVGVSGATFSLRTSAGAAVPAAVSYNAYWKRAELRTAENLQPATTYVATATSGIASTTGRAIAQTSWRFTTEGATAAPEDGSEVFDPPARVAFRQGTHTGYRFDANGVVTGTRTLTLSRDSGASTSLRKVLPNQSGTWFYIVNGAWAGYWIRESNGLSLAATATTATTSPDATYQPPARVAFRQGTHTGYAFSATGAVVSEKTFTLAWDSGANASARRTVANQYGSWFVVTNGVWAGYLVRESDVIRLP